MLFYRALSKALGDDVPFYGLQSCGLDGSSGPLNSIEAMAKAYIDEIKTVQATGPYHLGGYCLGGIIAYETARLLKERGDEVALLALFDSYNPARLAPVTALSHLTQRVYFHMRNLVEVPFGQWKSYMHQKLQIAREGELRLITDSILGSRKAREESLQQRIHSANFEALMRYRPKPYPGVVTSFRPKRNYSVFSGGDMGWDGLALEGVKDIELDLGPHAMLVGPFVEKLADRLTLELSSAQDLHEL